MQVVWQVRDIMVFSKQRTLMRPMSSISSLSHAFIAPPPPLFGRQKGYDSILLSPCIRNNIRTNTLVFFTSVPPLYFSVFFVKDPVR